MQIVREAEEEAELQRGQVTEEVAELNLASALFNLAHLRQREVSFITSISSTRSSNLCSHASNV